MHQIFDQNYLKDFQIYPARPQAIRKQPMSEFSEIAAQLPDPFRLLWRESVGSTNDEIRKLAEQGMAEGLVMVADEQIAGRGRRGAVWVSPKGENLAFSILLKPMEPKVLWHRLSLVTGLAVAEALENYVPLAEIKWPNDIKAGGKKIAGILVEAGKEFVIIGIGININTSDFPEELAATSLRDQTGRIYSRAEVLHEVVTRMSHYANGIDHGYADSLKSIRERCALTGHFVSYLIADQRREGFVRGIGSGGELMVETDGKLEALVQADEVRILD
jgi:BirA family transcriptional regulator, biotin operon repressor / biotin---[acetyl-CoA-carboxylase] ligase